MDPISLVHATGASEAPNSPHAKVLKAGAQFEAVLLNNVLGAVEHAFTELPGSHDHQSTEAYSGVAMQTLASKLAEGGGLVWDACWQRLWRNTPNQLVKTLCKRN